MSNTRPPQRAALAREVRQLLRFSPDGGRVWMDDARIALISSQAFANLRRALIEGIGFAATAQMFTRIGYAEGSKDAKLYRRLHPHGSVDEALAARAHLQALAGFASAGPSVLDARLEHGHFHCELTWNDSLEAALHGLTHGTGTEPVCWILAGHASGYFTGITGRAVLFREVDCRAAGAARCRVIGKPAQEWGTDAHGVAGYLRPQPEVNRFMALPDAAPVDDDVVGGSPGFFAALHLARKVAPTRAAALLLGETGVGKEVFARMLHRISPRAGQAFVAVNCAAIPENLAEGELFGVERGAYTGASASRPGRFERAHAGTLFLDEVGSLSLAAQGKLLRALQHGEIERVGDRITRRVDVRVIAATNVDLAQAMRAGQFREDLYFRLNVFPITIPPLRERPEDIPLLLSHFLRRFAAVHAKRITGITAPAAEALLAYDYPGNVRELEHMIERAVILADDGAALDLSHFASFGAQLSRHGAVAGVPAPGTAAGSAPEIPALLARGMSLATLERELLEGAVRAANGNLAGAARALGLTRAQLAYRLRRQADHPPKRRRARSKAPRGAGSGRENPAHKPGR